MIASKLFDHSFITTHKSFCMICGSTTVSLCCRGLLVIAFYVNIFKIELLDALVDWKERQECPMVKMWNLGLRVAHVCSEIVRSKLFIDFSLEFLHLSDNDSPLLIAHLFNLRTPYLVLRHIGDLEHHARVLQI